MQPPALTLFGRSSSVFTRVARIFAAELGVEYQYDVVSDLLSTDARDYGDHPGLKLPSLRTPHASWFGSLNICYELVRWSDKNLTIVWPELHVARLANAQELVLQAMSTEVSWIMTQLSDGPSETAYRRKLLTSLRNVMSWLDANVEAVLAELPENRRLSYLEVTLFCLTSHLEFRDVLPLTPYAALQGFRERFAARPSCAATEFRFDA